MIGLLPLTFWVFFSSCTRVWSPLQRLCVCVHSLLLTFTAMWGFFWDEPFQLLNPMSLATFGTDVEECEHFISFLNLFVVSVICWVFYLEENVHAHDPWWKLQCDFHDWKSIFRHFQSPGLNLNSCALTFLDIYNMASSVRLWIFEFAHFALKSPKAPKLKLSSGTNIAVSNPVDSSPNQAWSGLPWI